MFSKQFNSSIDKPHFSSYFRKTNKVFVVAISLLMSAPAVVAQELSSSMPQKDVSWSMVSGILVVTALILILLGRLISNKKSVRKLDSLATSEALTGFMNQQQTIEAVNTQLESIENNGGKLSIALVDIDRLMFINDKFGYFTGDKVLKLFTELCIENLSKDFELGRVTEEGFLIVMPEVGIDCAYKAIEDLRLAMGEVSDKINMPDLKVTISAGICEYRKTDTSDKMVQLATTALFRAKTNGKNMVVQCERSEDINI
ncbi:GGDEF domain-containing protein [Paraglaciecola sp. 2405UD69-4]|uniref:GGDEF domain-containing protein n=1 Tax=Paraglaciecola sp. 2405UD69-4 TaxID=3391836 RepID=UPI0039C96D2A